MHAVEQLPPGPAAPAAAQTVEWIARPTDLLRRSAARYGEPFTLRTLWADAPMVLVSDPETIRRVYAAPPATCCAAAPARPCSSRSPGPSSILLTSGEAHLRRRRQMLPPFHGERMEAHRAEIAALAEAELARWRARDAAPDAAADAGADPRRDPERRPRRARIRRCARRSARRST